MTTIITNQKQAHKTKHVAGVMFRCGCCKEVKEVQHSGGTGYGYWEEYAGDKPVCYDCMAALDHKHMRKEGKHVLYLTTNYDGSCSLSNWPGTLTFKGGYRHGRHNMARVRYDVWFVFEGEQWHGTTYGDNTQICRVRRTKAKVN